MEPSEMKGNILDLMGLRIHISIAKQHNRKRPPLRQDEVEKRITQAKGHRVLSLQRSPSEGNL